METVKVEKQATSLREFTRLIISFLFCLLVLTIYQYVSLYFKGVVDSVLSISFVLAVVSHIGFSALIGLLLVGPYHFLERFKPSFGFKFTYVLLLVLLAIEGMLIAYFTTTLLPLGSDLLGYSMHDISITLSNSGGISLPFVVGLILIIVFFAFGYKFTKKFYHHISKMFPLTIVFFSVFIATLFTEGKPINQNKTKYLTTNLFISTTEDITYTTNLEYPLLKDAKEEDVLGSYFNLKEKKPNIVFVVVKGLGRDFVGQGAEFGGFTPFLDSLSQKSLYWENFLSNTGRTFGVMPSILGSLPFGKSGFMELNDYPNKLTLLTVLKNNGYYTSFFQGTNSSFDNLDNFLRSENVDLIIEQSNFGSNYEKQAPDTDGSSWGYPDKGLFAKSLSLNRKKDQPRLEVYITISNHEPFLPPNQELREAQVDQIVTNGKYEKREKNIINKNKNIFATLLYTDAALQFFLDGYKKLPDYDNTIFIITGDHRLIPIPQETTLSRFKVPFIIYSPMLNTSKKLSAVSSHLDVTPTLLAMLNNKYKINMPSKVAWLGGTIDMHSSFRSIKNIPLMRNKNEMKEYISNEYFLSDGALYKMNKNLELSSSFSTDESALKTKLDNFKGLNAYLVNENKIIPDSLVIYKTEKIKFTNEETVWINSQFNGKDFDNAYKTARELAFDKEPKKALLLIKYILSETPSHIDAKILQGRINAWEGNYDTAISIFEACLVTNRGYDDIYSALLDVCFWSDNNEKVLTLFDQIQENKIDSEEVNKKVARAYKQLKKEGQASSTIITNAKIEAFIASTH